jgi:polysaccharide export outer membrane protein
VGTLLKSLALLLVLIALALLGGCAATDLPRATTDLDTRSTVADWSAFTLGPNDLVTVDVFGAPQYGSSPRGVRIAPDGTLALPLLGSVPVGGRTALEVASAVEAGLSEYLAEPRVSVAVVEYSSRRFYLFGEVKQPGPVPMDRPITALEALAMGGGWQPGANREHVVIVRTHGEEVEVIEFDGATPGPDGLVQVRPDDFLFVGKAGVGVFSESMMPYLQGLGMTASQLASLVLVTDKLND